MGKVAKFLLILMTVLTVVYVCAVVYAYANLGDNGDSSRKGKYPSEYGIYRAYCAERRDTVPLVWNTTEELGITFGDPYHSSIKESYPILIVDLEKALPWMTDANAKPYKYQPPYPVEYEGKYYDIGFLWLTPGDDKPLDNWQIPTGAALGVSWGCTGILVLKKRKD